MYDTPPLTVDPTAIRAWLAQPSDDFPEYSRAESLGVDGELTAPGVGGLFDTRVEDPDLWRFVHDSSVHIGVPATVVADGRTPFEVFRDQRFLVLSPR